MASKKLILQSLIIFFISAASFEFVVIGFSHKIFFLALDNSLIKAACVWFNVET